MLTILASFFYIIDGGMILHRLKRRTAKIKIDLLMFFARELTENNFQRSQAKSDAPHSIYTSGENAHFSLAVVQEDIDVLVLLI
jgi:hypothetical protein